MIKETFKIYPPTISGTKEMFSDYEKDMARDEMIEMKIDDAIAEKHERRNAEYCDELERQHFKFSEPL